MSDPAPFIAALVAAVGSEPLSVAEIIAEARQNTPAAARLAAEIQKLQPGREKVSGSGLGQKLKRFCDTPAGALVLRCKRETHNNQLRYAALPVGAEFPKRRRAKAIYDGRRKEFTRRVNEKVERMRAADERNLRRYDIAEARKHARQMLDKPTATAAAGDTLEKRYTSRTEQERIAKHSPGTYSPRSEGAPQPRQYPPGGQARKAVRPPVRVGVLADGLLTQTAALAHKACYDFCGLGVVCEVRTQGGKFHLFSPTAPSELEARRLRFIRSGFRAEAGDDSASEAVATPMPVYERCNAPGGRRAMNWPVFD